MNVLNFIESVNNWTNDERTFMNETESIKTRQFNCGGLPRFHILYVVFKSINPLAYVELEINHNGTEITNINLYRAGADIYSRD